MNQAFFYKHFNIRLLQTHILKNMGGDKHKEKNKNCSKTITMILYNIIMIFMCARETCRQHTRTHNIIMY